MLAQTVRYRPRFPPRRERRRLAILAALPLVAAVARAPVLPADEPRAADLGRVFASWEQWRDSYDELAAAMSGFTALNEQPIESAERLATVMQARDRLLRIASAVEGYVYLRLQLSGADEEARSRQRLLDETDRIWNEAGSPRFTRAIDGLGRERIDAWMADSETLRRYEFFFRRFFDLAGHPYPDDQGRLRSLAGASRRQSTRVYNALAVAEAPTVEVTLETGERRRVKPGPARTLLGGVPSPVDRRALSRARLKALGRQSQTYAALLQGIVEHERLAARMRGFDSALSARLHDDAIPADTVRDAVRVARRSTAPLRRYHALRRRVLGLEEYGLADRFVPLDPAGREIGFAEARRLIVDSSSTLGPEVRDLVERAFSDGWIDAIARPGKRPNAGSTVVAGRPYVLLDYRGLVENVFQLAHEIGHAVHGYLAYEAQPIVYAARSSLTSETVAGVFEGLLTERLVGQPASREEKIRVLDLSIQNILRLFYRPMLHADFELRLYETEQSITGPALGALYLEVVRTFYGDSVRIDDWDAHGWQETPHFFTSPLYMGRYGLAAAAANSLTPRLTSPVEAQAAAARHDFLALMRAGSHGYPLELLAEAGADLGSRPVMEALPVRLEWLVDELERAVDGR